MSIDAEPVVRERGGGERAFSCHFAKVRGFFRVRLGEESVFELPCQVSGGRLVAERGGLGVAQLDQHLGVALRGVDAFQAQEALGQRLGGLFTDDDDLAEQILAAGSSSGGSWYWSVPMPEGM